MLFSKTPSKYAALLCFGLLFQCPGARAEEATPEHGKINSPDASPVDPGQYEVETTYSYTFAKRLWDSNGDTRTRGFTYEHAAGLSATAGILENFDVTLNSAYNWLKDKENDFDNDGNLGPETGHGIGDLGVHGRYRFFQSAEHSLDVATIVGFTIPTGRHSNANEIGTSQEYWSFDQTLVASHDWGKGTANADIGYALPFGDKRGDARGTLNADLAGGYQLLPWLQPEMELNYTHAFIADTDDSESLALTAGFVMPINDRWRINTGVQQGLWGTNVDKATSFSVAVKVAF
ncbi:MAG: transporter [Bdellovibrionales bacterium]